MFTSYEAFEKEIQSVFRTLNEEQDILMKLGHLKQKEEVSKYTAAFRRLQHLWNGQTDHWWAITTKASAGVSKTNSPDKNG